MNELMTTLGMYRQVFCVYIYMYYMHINLFKYIYHMYIYTHTHIAKFTYIYMIICTYVMYVYVYIYNYQIYIYTYSILIQNQPKQSFEQSSRWRHSPSHYTPVSSGWEACLGIEMVPDVFSGTKNQPFEKGTIW